MMTSLNHFQLGLFVLAMGLTDSKNTVSQKTESRNSDSQNSDSEKSDSLPSSDSHPRASRHMGDSPYSGRNLQRTHWYSLQGSPTASPGSESVDYHLAPEPAPPPSTYLPAPLLSSPMANLTARLGETVSLRCAVSGFIQGVHTVSWTQTPTHKTDPIALTFNDMVFVSDPRIRVYIDIDTWVLVIQSVVGSDSGLYECHLSSQPPLKLPIHLSVTVPILRVTDGFGRPLADQYYKAGSSLEVVCQLSSLPSLPSLAPGVSLLQWHHHGLLLLPQPLHGLSIQSEAWGEGVTSRLAITQAGSSHSGNYTCSVPPLLATTVRIHILNDENQAFVASGSTTSLPGHVMAALLMALSTIQ